MEIIRWTPSESAGHVTWTRTWRIVTYDPGQGAEARLYIAVAPADLYRAYELIFPALEQHRVNHRHARDAATLERYADQEMWSGKAFIIDPHPAAWESVANELDQRLAGQGLAGPTVLAGARPYGGQSGLLFTRREAKPPDARRQRLSHLLNQ